MLGTIGEPLAVDRAQSAYGVAGTITPAVPDPWLPRPTGLPARVSLTAQSGLAAHAIACAPAGCRAPHGRSTRRPPRWSRRDRRHRRGSLRIEVGAVIHIPAPGRRHISPCVGSPASSSPRDPDGAYWSTVPLLRTPSLVTLPHPGPGPRPVPLAPAHCCSPGGGPRPAGHRHQPGRYWHLAPDPAPCAPGLDRLRPAVAALESGPALQRARAVTDQGADVDTDLDEALAAFSRLRSASPRWSPSPPRAPRRSSPSSCS
ncbi:hypothetical protein LT493_02905 [Streptomyces tricolor]|nr:hypothetical protein [Streptomyces tricolor]